MLVYTLFFATDIVVQTIFLPDHVGGHFFWAQNIQMMEELCRAYYGGNFFFAKRSRCKYFFWPIPRGAKFLCCLFLHPPPSTYNGPPLITQVFVAMATVSYMWRPKSTHATHGYRVHTHKPILLPPAGRDVKALSHLAVRLTDVRCQIKRSKEEGNAKETGRLTAE